jgi:CubicO group peptidase (beta-lactamase class C family)
MGLPAPHGPYDAGPMRPYVRRAALALALGLPAGIAWLALRPPELIRVGAGYTAKIVCSNVFIAGRDAEQVLALDVQAPGHPLLRLMRVSVDRDARSVRAGLFGVAGDGLAVARDGIGCATVPDGDLARARAFSAPPAPAAPPAAGRGAWPQGDAIDAAEPPLDRLLADPALAGPGMRALVVVHRGRIVAERYGDGFGPATPLLGWSMTKTVTAALVGTAVREGRLDPGRAELLPQWAGDGRRAITGAQLLAMASGLAFDEDYGSVTDVTRMLYLEPDMAGFAAAQPLRHPPGAHFSYASGSSVLLAQQWQQAIGAEALAWPRRALFEPLGMRSAVIEADARGTFVGSSYLYATARDWARFALLLLQDGQWDGRALLPPGWVARMREPSAAGPTEYSRGQMWLHGPADRLAGDGSGPARHADTGFALPADTRWMLGHDGQSIAIVPSRELAVVRLGLTPSALGHRPQRLVQELLRVLP